MKALDWVKTVPAGGFPFAAPLFPKIPDMTRG